MLVSVGYTCKDLRINPKNRIINQLIGEIIRKNV